MNIRDLPGLSPAADGLPPRRGLSKPEAAARVLFQGVAILGISATLGFVFLLLPVFLTFGSIFGHDSWPDQLPVLLWLLLLLLGCMGLLLFRRWAAVLVCGLGWGWLVYVCYVKAATVGPTLFFDSAVPVVTVLLVGLPLVATLLMTVSVIVYWPHLKNGL
jgi:hypothetical protein